MSCLSNRMRPVVVGMTDISHLRAVCLRPAAAAATSSLPSAPPFTPLIQRASMSDKEREKLRQMQLDPYRWQQAQDRRNANLARRAQLTAERQTAWGDPVQGLPTPFLESLDSAGQDAESPVPRDDEGRPLEEPRPLPTSPHILNYQLTQQEVDEAVEETYQIVNGGPTVADPSGMGIIDDSDRAAMGDTPEAREARHHRAIEAITRITTLQNASSKDRRHANIRRIVETFGRHNTDSTVRQKGLAWDQEERIEKIRGGPDTGSSEVQIAILTAKIRVLAKMLAGEKGNKDKHNKKNLRLLVHRRQKLLAYMERKERGSGRWEHMIATLGLSPATWKKEIEIR